MNAGAAVAPHGGPGRLWFVTPSCRPGPAVATSPRGRAVCFVSLPEAITRAAPGDLAVLPPLSPGQTVESAAPLLERGVRVAVDLSGYPEVARPLGPAVRGGRVLLSPGPPPRTQRAAMRARDAAAALLALTALSPLLAAIAIAVKRSSPGPVFFSTTVIGKDGRPFLWRKFRSMRPARAEDDARRAEQYRALVETGVSGGKLIDAERITPVGRFIRRHSLDELPQLWNVLRGEMTLIGPRPCLPYEYAAQPAWQHRRYRVTPGLSGPWQAYGRGRVSVDEMALMDYCYGYRKTFASDLRLILHTLRAVVWGENV